MADRSAFCSRRCCSKFVPVFYFFGSSYHARARKHVRTHLQCQHFSVRRVCSKLFWHTRLALTVFFLKHDDVGNTTSVEQGLSIYKATEKVCKESTLCCCFSIANWRLARLGCTRILYVSMYMYIYMYIISETPALGVFFFFPFFWGTRRLDQSLCL